MKRAISVICFIFLINFLSYAQKNDPKDVQSQIYFVISVGEEAIYYNGKAINAKDKIPAKAKLYFSSHTAKAVVYSEKEGKFILTIERTNEKGEKLGLMQPIENAIVPPMDFFFLTTRGDSESVSLDDFASILQDNPVDSDLITIYFIDKKPFIIPIPKVLTENDAFFALKNKTHFLKLPIKDGKLKIELQLSADDGKMIDIQQSPQLQLYYHAGGSTTPYLLGRMKFENF